MRLSMSVLLFCFFLLMLDLIVQHMWLKFCCFAMFRRKAQEKQLKEQEESLQEWEKKLKESQNRLVDLQRSINDREERANKSDQLFKIKHGELEEARKSVEANKHALKAKEDDINRRLNELHSQEKVFNLIPDCLFFIWC